MAYLHVGALIEVKREHAASVWDRELAIIIGYYREWGIIVLTSSGVRTIDIISAYYLASGA